jgi:hypothetical protein
VDNAAGLTLSFPANFFATGQANDATQYLAVHWTAAFSNAAPVTFSLSADDHAFLFIDGVLVQDVGGVKGIGAPIVTPYALTGNHTLDLFFADVHTVQSVSPSAATGVKIRRPPRCRSRRPCSCSGPPWSVSARWCGAG